MSKELIVSVNGREKKIAILENGRVTEFYIERGESNSGVVGNIYKGRVMRVLPGMQSAFVDIGLERDAFLYVSDFFDEEEEFERIVIEKEGDPKTTSSARESQKPETHRHRQAPTELEVPKDVAIQNGEVEQVEELPSTERVKDRNGLDPRGGRRRRGRPYNEETRRGDQPEVSPEETGTGEEIFASREQTPFAGLSSFERIMDDEAAEDGSMLKDAILQERIFDQIHAVEFDMESSGPLEVGSLVGTGSDTSSFERIDDTDVDPVFREKRAEDVHEAVSAHIEKFIDDVVSDSFISTAESGLYERVDDEEREQVATSIEQAPPDEKRPKRGRSRIRPKSTDDSESDAPKTARKTSSRTRTTTRKTEKGPRRTKASSQSGANEPSDESNTTDVEARISGPRNIGEFTTRRGGRRRRRPGKHSDQSGNVERRPTDGDAGPVTTENGAGEGAAPPPPRQFNGRGRHDGRGGRNRERPPQPTITDLLREGQEIIVQIAKEPISQKGARITSHIALPGRFLVYMPTIEHIGVSRKIESDTERSRLRKLIQTLRSELDITAGGFIVRTAGVGVSDEELRNDAHYLARTWHDIRETAEKVKAPALVHRDLDLVQRIMRDQLSDDFTAIRVDNEEEYLGIIEFVNRVQPKLVRRVKLYTREEPILEAYGVQQEVEKAIKPRVWLKSGGYLVINQTEALVAIDVNTGKFVGKGGNRLEDTITKTNLEAVDEIVRQIRLRDLGGIIVLDLIDMEERRNRQKVMQALQEALQNDKSPTKVLSFNDFGLVIMTRKRVKQSLERTLCAPCSYCQGSGMIKSPQTVCYEILEESRRLSKSIDGDKIKHTTLRVNPEIARVLYTAERDIVSEIEDYLGPVDITSDETIHQEQFDFAFV
jgi:ribonuclease G